MITISVNKWARITDNHWVHPDIGYVKYAFEKWEAHPKAHLSGKQQIFDDFQQAVEYMNSLNTL